jgi:hypothetical protein
MQMYPNQTVNASQGMIKAQKSDGITLEVAYFYVGL